MKLRPKCAALFHIVSFVESFVDKSCIWAKHSCEKPKKNLACLIAVFQKAF